MKKKTKVVLITVISRGMVDTIEEIGICSIASFLRKNGYEVMLLQAGPEEIDYKANK